MQAGAEKYVCLPNAWPEMSEPSEDRLGTEIPLNRACDEAVDAPVFKLPNNSHMGLFPWSSTVSGLQLPRLIS